MLTTHRMVRLAIVCFVMSLASVAAARPATRPALHWSRGEGAASCIDPRALSLRVTALTGSVLVEPTSADVSIEGHVKSTGEGFEVHVSSTSASGSQRGDRTLRHAGEDCHDLDDAIAFVVALMIDPGLALEALPPSLVGLGVEGPASDELLRLELEAQPPRPAENADAAPLARVKTRPVPQKEPKSSSAGAPLPLELQGALLVSGELPDVALGGLLAGNAIPLRWLAIELQIRAVKMLQPLALDEVRSVDASLLAAAVLACPRLQFARRVLFEACLGPELHGIRARGRGFVDASSSQLLGYAAHLAAGIGLALYRNLELRLRTFGRFSVGRQHFVYTLQDGKYEAFASPRASAGASLGLSYRF